jgi:predicted tellurium resistance membrane protein TerC
VSRRGPPTWGAVWIRLAIVLNIGVYKFRGQGAGLEWTTGHLVEKSPSVDNVFVFLHIFSAFGVVRASHSAPSLESNRLVRLAERSYKVTDGYEGQRYFVKRNGVRYRSPLFLVLLLVESTDLVFAVNSIPAIYVITDWLSLAIISTVLGTAVVASQRVARRTADGTPLHKRTIQWGPPRRASRVVESTLQSQSWNLLG